MNKFTRFLPIVLALPLAACFDMDMTMSFPDADHAEMVSVMTASPEFYAMSTEGGGEDDLCDTGEGVVQDDGSYICTETHSGTIDELLADPSLTEGMTLERRDGGQIFVAFDLASITSEMAPPEEEAGDAEAMKGMLADAFEGHAITINVVGSEIIETNGEISEDGTKSTFTIPLMTLLEDQPDLPESFDTLLNPGS